MDQSMKRETASLLLEFCKVDAEKKSPFYKKWDETIRTIKRKMSESDGNFQKNHKKAMPYWRDTKLPYDLYWYLRWSCFPFPIPYVLFFSFKNLGGRSVESIKCAGNLADKWLKDIFSKESFYKRNKEYFTRVEVKYFLSCDWNNSIGNCYDLIDYFFNTKIKANDLYLSVDVFRSLTNYFTHQIVIEYFKFLCDNKKYINNAEIKEINEFLKSEYISVGKNIDFKNYTYHSLKRLSDEWRISNVLRLRFGHRYEHKIVQDYLTFICKNVRNIRDKEEKIRDICDFLNNRINNEQDFNFENITWQELKRLSDEWHLENIWARDPYSRNYLNTKWKKSPIKDFDYEKDGKTWIIKEITTGKSLYEEGHSMQHCVFSYADKCIHGYCFIFSVSCKSGKDDSEKRIATLEISKYREIVQARGPCNASIDNETAEIIKIWADENGIDYKKTLSNRRRVLGRVA